MPRTVVCAGLLFQHFGVVGKSLIESVFLDFLL